MKGYSTPEQAAAKLGVSPSRVRQLIRSGRIKAETVGTYKFITNSELNRFKKLPRNPGRPKRS